LVATKFPHSGDLTVHYRCFVYLKAGPQVISGTGFYQQWYVQFKFKTMLRWTVIFLIVAIVAAIFGFGGIAAGAASIAKFIFFLFLVLFVISLFSGAFKRP
jgi:uncharacterized membrane protein YtjA (UPF0391 family)